ncbi:uncharacterized protein LOC115828972 [Chanos chanos]|uniref:Uncharacterized protein LOC115828972 n=1 Tax=Chanos chanos TaxID=29144 RepID=A0A6J2WXG0_CHACN|nr:uncharacterized protein LOC115828972 [Chanos chanos]
MLLLPQLAGEKGCLLEIGTGEGKSCILAMFAVIHAIRGTKVDIVTSSPVLARRDEEEWRKLFDMFGVTSSVVPPPFSEANTPEKCENLLQQAYNKQIVYGTVGAFAADILKQEFEKKTTRGHRNFELVIVDEVDYMTLDHGVQVTFLSHDSSGLRHMEQVLASIWTMTSACRPIEMLETGEIKWVTRLQHFHKATMAAFLGSETSEHFSAYDILLPGLQLGFYAEEDIEMLKQAENKEETEDEASDFQGDKWKAIESIISKIGVSQQYDLLTLFESVMENKVSFECYSVENNKARLFGTQKEDSDVKISMLLLENGQACEIMSEKSIIEATVGELQKKIKYSTYCPSKDETQKFIVIPSFLKKYIESQLPVFVENALKAIQMTQGREYMIDSHAIIPVDFKSSGVLEKNKRWGNGLQQFLEMKHQLAISQLSNVTNYMSNFHYFKRYLKGNGIFGVSGTLGGDADKAFLKKQYQTETYAIPSHRHKKVVELPAVQVKGGSDLWIQTLCETVLNVANKGQVVLVICEDVRTADVLQKKLQDEEICLSHPITMYTISERHNIEKKTFHGGSIIIATNLGGRGTDVKVEREVNQCGGLFVLLTYFPQNRRVERQIFGRTGRKGNPGMVQMILNSDYLAPAYQGQSVETMRHLREEYEVKRIRDMENDELLEIEMKEKLFSKFCRFLDDFDNRYEVEEKKDISTMELGKIPKIYQSHHPKFDYQPALNALKESWALWLTLHEEQISNHDDIETLEADLLREMENTGDMLLNGKSNNFYDYIKQAIIRTDLHCRNKSKCDYGALSYWQDVAESDPFYNAVALNYQYTGICPHIFNK